MISGPGDLLRRDDERAPRRVGRARFADGERARGGRPSAGALALRRAGDSSRRRTACSASAGAASAVLARLDVRDPALAVAIDEMRLSVDRTGSLQRRGRRKVVVWSIAATASLVLVGIFGVPVLADVLAPLVPQVGRASARRRGRRPGARDARSRPQGKPFECGKADAEKPGDAPPSTGWSARLEGQRRCPFRSRSLWCAARKPTRSRFRVAASTCSRA